MIFAAISDKGGTGRTVTSANVAYQLTKPSGSRPAASVCVVDLDLGSPTFGAVLGLEEYERGAELGVHDVLTRRHAPHNADDLLVDVWDEWQDSDDDDAPSRQPGVGDLALLPGKRDGGDVLFSEVDQDVLSTARALLHTLNEEYEVVLLDLSSGRSVVMDMIAHADLADLRVHWLVHHRWTRQHLVAVQGLVHGRDGLASKVSTKDIYYVRTAVNTPRGDGTPLDDWVKAENKKLTREAERRRVGNLERVVGQVPVEPTLYWGERLIREPQVDAGIAQQGTLDAFRSIADFVYERARA